MRDLGQIISAGVGPIIVISACGLLGLAFYNRLTAVVTRLRAFDRERLREQEALEAHGPGAGAEVLAPHLRILDMLAEQTEMVKRRAHLIRRTLVCLLSTIGCLALCSLAVGLSSLCQGLLYVAVPLFVIGLLLVVVAVVFALLELRYALGPVEIEARTINEMMGQ